MKAKTTLVAIVVALFLFGLGVVKLLSLDGTKRAYDCVEIGMSKEEVERLFGRKWDRQNYGPKYWYPPGKSTSPFEGGGGEFSWESRDGSWAIITFSDNRVIWTRWFDGNASLFNCLRPKFHPPHPVQE